MRPTGQQSRVPTRAPTLRLLSPNEDRTIELGELVGGVLRPGDLLTLDGPLGAGKTRFVRGVARSMGVDDRLVASPTYVLVHEYPVRSPLDPPLIHIDAYRLNSHHELDSIAWDRLADPAFGAVILVEWGERIAPALADHASLARIEIAPDGAESRVIVLDAPMSWTTRPQWNRLSSYAEGLEGASQTRCPVCGGQARAGCPLPFCSERCRMADLGKWFGGQYAVSRELTDDDLNDQDLRPPGGVDGGR